MRAILTAALCIGLLSTAAAVPIRPDPDRTPGIADKAITEKNYRTVLCADENGNKIHTTDEKRPTTAYTTGVKVKQLKAWGYTDKVKGHYEEDHLISLELGGDDSDERNLWPQPYAGTWGAKTKDTLELELGRRICLHRGDTNFLTLAQARKIVAGDWITAYKEYVCKRTIPPARPLTKLMKAHCHQGK